MPFDSSFFFCNKNKLETEHSVKLVLLKIMAGIYEQIRNVFPLQSVLGLYQGLLCDICFVRISVYRENSLNSSFYTANIK